MKHTIVITSTVDHKVKPPLTSLSFRNGPYVLIQFSGGKGHLNVTWRGGAHFLRTSTTCFGKKFAFRYPVSELLDKRIPPNNRENNSLLFLKTIAYCSWTNSHNLFRNFWSIFIPGSGIYAEKWYPEKRHVPYRFMWKCPLPPGNFPFSVTKSLKT